MAIETKNIILVKRMFLFNFFLIFKHFSVSRIKRIQIFKDMSIDQSEH